MSAAGTGGNGLDRARAALAGARRVAVLTGAGVSAASGIPTFRGGSAAGEGLWQGYDPASLATPEAFARDPLLVWGWYAARAEAVARARPNAAHEALTTLAAPAAAPGAAPGGRQVVIVTQNVDGLHARAGAVPDALPGDLPGDLSGGPPEVLPAPPSADPDGVPEPARRSSEPPAAPRLVELHGNLTRSRCLQCKRRRPLSLPLRLEAHGPPRCGHCGGLLRPDVVWFGELLPEGALIAAVDAFERSEVALVVGTSGVVEPAASLARLAAERGAVVIEVNPEPTPLSSWAEVSLRRPAEEGLPALIHDLPPP